jgi:hypothetical protein
MKPRERLFRKNTTKKLFCGGTARSLFSLTLLAATQTAFAGAELKISDDASVNLGIGLRTSYTSASKAAPNGTSRSNDFNLENVRLYMSGQYGKVIKATFNTERTGGPSSTGGDNVRVMDAIVQFEFMPEFNIWMGRMLPPSDRSNLDGPFYVLPWSYPGVVSNYTNIAVGRDNGVMVWGKPLGGKLVYAFGLFEGHNKNGALSGGSDKLQYSGRIAYNILDPEPAPAYYTGSWYGGSKDILTIALAGSTQQDGAGTAIRKGNLSIWSADILFEKKIPGGVPTLEGAYYKYKVGAVDCGSGEPGAVACPVGDNLGGQVDGKAYLLGAGFLIDQKVGWGQFQPFVRFQKYDRSLSNTRSKATDIGVNYIIKGPNAKISAMYSKFDDNRLPIGKHDNNQFTLGVQLQY